MAHLRARLSFSRELVKAPILHELALAYPDVITSIRRADVERGEGWVLLEMSGSDEGLEAAVGWLRGRRVGVDLAEGDVVEG